MLLMQNLELFVKDSTELDEQSQSQAKKNLQKVQKYAQKCFENRQNFIAFANSNVQRIE